MLYDGLWRAPILVAALGGGVFFFSLEVKRDALDVALTERTEYA